MNPSKPQYLPKKFRDFIDNNKDPISMSPPETKLEDRKNQEAFVYSELQDPKYLQNFECWDKKDPDSIAVAGDS